MMRKVMLGGWSGILVLVVAGYAPIAAAYVGPGLGAGVISAVLGILGGLLLLVVGVIWYPIKRLARYFRKSK